MPAGIKHSQSSAFQKSIELNPLHGDSYWCLANTKAYHFSAAQVSQMQDVEADPKLGSVDRAQLCFALGKAFEDSSQFEESFRYYNQGNTIKRESSFFSPEQLERRIKGQIDTCTVSFFESLAGLGVDNRDPYLHRRNAAERDRHCWSRYWHRTLR